MARGVNNTGSGTTTDLRRLPDFQIWDKFPFMEITTKIDQNADQRLALRLRAVRLEAGWSLDDLAKRSGVSRATLSRMENGDVSPTANALGKLCAAYEITMSRLMHMIEEAFQPKLQRSEQLVWMDPAGGFRRRAVSPPARTLAGEALECELDAGTSIACELSARRGLEHHLVMLEGQLTLTIDGSTYRLLAGDCLRYRLHGASQFSTGQHCGARYMLFIV